MNVLDLFSGIGGFSLGLERAGMRTVAFCEPNEFCRKVLAKHWPDVPRYIDVRDMSGAGLLEDGIRPDVVCGGFPCQDISSSGAKVGLQGARSCLWHEFARLLGELRPKFAIVENVSDILARGIGDVLSDLAALGYDAEWHCIPASFVGLPQARERVWIIAYPDSRRRQRGSGWNGEGPILRLGDDDDRLAVGQCRARNARSYIRRADHGIPGRVDRLRALGNAVVPQIPEIIGRAIMNAEASLKAT